MSLLTSKERKTVDDVRQAVTPGRVIVTDAAAIAELSNHARNLLTIIDRMDGRSEPPETYSRAWEKVESTGTITYRLRVFGGWLVRRGTGTVCSFVTDPDGLWNLVKTVVLLALLAAPARASWFNWNGESDEGAQVSGRFEYVDAAALSWTVADADIYGGAIRGAALTSDTMNWEWTQPGAADAIKIGGDLSFQDANLNDGSGKASSFFWSSSRWALQVWDDAVTAAHEWTGHVLTVYRDAYFPEHTEVVQLPEEEGGDAAPVPEPSSLILLGAALVASAVFRKRRRKTLRVFGMPE